MGLSSCQHDYAWSCHGQAGRDDRRQAPPRLRRKRQRVSDRLSATLRPALLIFLTLWAFTPARAETITIATYNTELSRKGPGLLLRDLRRGSDDQISAVLDQITAVAADVLVLQGIDYDYEGRALAALAQALADRGAPYPYRFAAPPNAGRMTDVDLDGNGHFHEPRDAQGYGRFFGAGAMAVLSRYPIDTDAVQDFSTLLWRDLPGARIPPGTKDAVRAVQRLSSHGHWQVPVQHTTLGRVTVLAFHATPPVFDGPEDRNGWRNHDEIRFWRLWLEGAFGPPPAQRFVIAGDANLDPHRGEGRREAIRALLSDPRLQDPLPGRDTVRFTQTGPLRTDYLLPSADWRVVAAGVAAATPTASRHRIVWATLGR